MRARACLGIGALLVGACTAAASSPVSATSATVANAPPSMSTAISTSTVASANVASGTSGPTMDVKRDKRLFNSNGTRKVFPPAAPDVPGKMHVFEYGDFGPQALAGMLLGEDCYSFGQCCCMEVGDAFDVRVVVYQGVTESEVARRYPTGPETGDYRVVRASSAKAFLSKHIAHVEGWPAEDRIPTLERTLRATQRRLGEAFR